MRYLHCFLAGWVIVASGLPAWGGGKGSALEALLALQTRIGSDACDLLVAIHGSQGQDQPPQWVILTVNPQSPNLCQQFQVDGSGVTDQGVPPGLYPSELPPGFMERSLVLVDSPYAFQTLHQAAVRARVSFNSVNYTMVAREYDKEPVWRLEALDGKGRTVGQVDLSGQSGAVYRSIWYYWDDVDTGSVWQGPRIVDSLLSDTAMHPPGQEVVTGGTATQPLRAIPLETDPKDKGGLFSRFRRSSRTIFNSPAPPPSSPSPVPVPAVEMAPESGVAVPVPAMEGAGPAGPTADVAPATGTGTGALR